MKYNIDSGRVELEDFERTMYGFDEEKLEITTYVFSHDEIYVRGSFALPDVLRLIYLDPQGYQTTMFYYYLKTDSFKENRSRIYFKKEEAIGRLIVCLEDNMMCYRKKLVKAMDQLSLAKAIFGSSIKTDNVSQMVLNILEKGGN